MSLSPWRRHHQTGQKRDDVFVINASIIKGLALAIAESCPKALVAVVSNPVNSLVPLIVEVLRSQKVAGAEKRVFGVCTLDVIRACTFAAEHQHVCRSEMVVPVIGAHAASRSFPSCHRPNRRSRSRRMKSRKHSTPNFRSSCPRPGSERRKRDGYSVHGVRGCPVHELPPQTSGRTRHSGVHVRQVGRDFSILLPRTPS